MPTPDPRARYPKGNVRLPIPTLSGGVGRQAPTKRAVNEAQNIDNALVTLERSVEKRSPMQFIRRYTNPLFDTLDANSYSEIDLGNDSSTADFFFYWLSVSDEQRYLIAIDYNGAKETYYSVYRTTSTGFYKCNIDSAEAEAMHPYLTYGNATATRNPLKAITIGPQLIILNTLVKSGYTSVLKTFTATDVTANTKIKLADTDVDTPVVDGDTYWCTVGMDGLFVEGETADIPPLKLFTEDVQGRKLVYFTSTPVDTEGQASLYIEGKFYIKNDLVYALIPANTDMFANYGYLTGGAGIGLHIELDPYIIADGSGDMKLLGAAMVLVFSAVLEGEAEGSTPLWKDHAGVTHEHSHWVLRATADGGPIAKYLPVEDWDYPEATKPYLGSALEDFSEFKFPPNASDVDDGNEGASVNINGTPVAIRQPVTPFPGGHATLAALYPDQLAIGKNDRAEKGQGKIYNVENSYAGESPGFYIVRNANDKPYVMLIRSPFEYSVIDRTRFPKIMKIDSFDANNIENFGIKNFELEHRVSGTLNTNPGPEAWKEGVQAPIQSMCFFRDRLFLSIGDIIFCSRTGDFSDFWVEDASTVQETDPIDIRLSTNKYAPVASMTPFQQYMFINTESDVQFTLQGSENRITPLNAEVSPTAFYSTAPLVDPILLGSQIYFFAPRRAYIYFNDDTVSVNQAIETSLSCPDYLPTNFGHVTVVPGYDTILMLDQDNPKYMYLYTNRYSGAKVSQNAFFRYEYRVDIAHVESFDNNMFFVTKSPKDTGTFVYNLGYQKFREEDYSVPLLDQNVTVDYDSSTTEVVYNAGADTTTFTINKYFNILAEYIYIIPSESDPRSGEVINLVSGSTVFTNGTVVTTLPGDLTFAGRRFVFGSGYTMNIELSPQYMRDERQNTLEGVLSLRTLALQHFNTGTYKVDKEIQGRRTTSLTFSPSELDALGYTSGFDVPLPLYEGKGETFSKVMGFSSDTKIFITSDYPSPVNITQIELKGRFTGKSSGFVR